MSKYLRETLGFFFYIVDINRYNTKFEIYISSQVTRLVLTKLHTQRSTELHIYLQSGPSYLQLGKPEQVFMDRVNKPSMEQSNHSCQC